MKIRTLFILLVFPMLCQGQLHHRFIDTLSAWTVSNLNFTGVGAPYRSYDQYGFYDSTYAESNGKISARYNHFSICIEDTANAEVWYVDESLPQDTVLLYKMNMQIGDTLIYRPLSNDVWVYPGCIPTADSLAYVLDTIDSVVIRGEIRTKLIFEKYALYDYDSALMSPVSVPCGSETWIDGIGSMRHTMFHYNSLDRFSVIHCYEYEDKTMPIPDFITSQCTAVGQEELTNQVGFELFPNPAEEVLTVSTEQPTFQVSVYNMLGHVVLAAQSKSRAFELDIHHLAPGHYLLQMQTDGVLHTKPFIKR